MKGFHYLFCWVSVVLISLNVWVENWAWMAGSIGMMALVIADAVVEAIRYQEKK